MRAARNVGATVVSLTLVACAIRKPQGEEGTTGGCSGPWFDNVTESEPWGEPVGEPFAEVKPGESLNFFGQGYTESCYVTAEGLEPQPLEPVELTVVLPGGEVVSLGTYTPRLADDGDDAGFAAEVFVPAGTQAGTAIVRDNLKHPTTHEFVVAD